MGKVHEIRDHEKHRPSPSIAGGSRQRQRLIGDKTFFTVVVLCLILAVNRVSSIWEKHRTLTIEQRVNKILDENPLIDGHNDLLIFVRGRYQNHIYNPGFKDKFENGGLPQHVDLPRLDQGKQGGAFWSAFWPCPRGDNGTDFSDERYSEIVRGTLDQLDLFRRFGQSYPKYFTPAADSSAAVKAFEEGRLISPVAIEGLHQIGNSLSTLRLFHQLGVRYATLTWNCHNKYADAALESGPNFQPHVAKPYWHGLSPAGRDLVKEMNRMGMLVDLAHVSKETMRDVLVGNGTNGWTGSLAPPIFSHSSAYAICPHPRNVPDDILEFVKKRNSVVMINFSPDFISCVPVETPSGLPKYYPQNNTLNQVVRHIRHIGELIGYDHVGLGTDFDGISATPKGLEDVSKFPDLVAELLRQGVSDENVGKIVGRNILRVWKEADEVAAKLQEHTLPLEDDFQDQWAFSALVANQAWDMTAVDGVYGSQAKAVVQKISDLNARIKNLEEDFEKASKSHPGHLSKIMVLEDTGSRLPPGKKSGLLKVDRVIHPHDKLLNRMGTTIKEMREERSELEEKLQELQNEGQTQ